MHPDDLIYSAMVLPGVSVPIVNGIPITTFDATRGDVPGTNPSDFPMAVCSEENISSRGPVKELCPPVGPGGEPFDYYGYVYSKYSESVSIFLGTWLPPLYFRRYGGVGVIVYTPSEEVVQVYRPDGDVLGLVDSLFGYLDERITNSDSGPSIFDELHEKAAYFEGLADHMLGLSGVVPGELDESSVSFLDDSDPRVPEFFDKFHAFPTIEEWAALGFREPLLALYEDWS